MCFTDCFAASMGVVEKSIGLMPQAQRLRKLVIAQIGTEHLRLGDLLHRVMPCRFKHSGPQKLCYTS
jgi:hypothetical protein